VLVAIAVVAISLAAIGSLIATSVRGARSLDRRLALVEIARAIETGLPDRTELKAGRLAGEASGHRWHIDVRPFFASNVDPRLPTPWVPQEVVITVQSPEGPFLQVNTVRLRRRPDG
jgi:general secretion pathway protein I